MLPDTGSGCPSSARTMHVHSTLLFSERLENTPLGVYISVFFHTSSSPELHLTSTTELDSSVTSPLPIAERLGPWSISSAAGLRVHGDARQS